LYFADTLLRFGFNADAEGPEAWSGNLGWPLN
jgi:hypothetical protein